MIKIEKTEVMGFDQAIRGMRNPMNSWGKSDSGICKGGNDGIGCINCSEPLAINNICDHKYDHSFKVGRNDYELMMKLVRGGPVHAKFRRMIIVYADITAPLYWWKGFDTYKVGTVANSCSTIHKIYEKEFTLEDFSCEHLLTSGDEGVFLGDWVPLYVLEHVIMVLNKQRDKYIATKDKTYWWQMIQLLPSSYNQKRTIMLNYEVLAGIYEHRKSHKLDEWKEFCKWIEGLPYYKVIIGQKDVPEFMKCDGRACKHCSPECQHTTDILHAKNFEIGIDGITMVERPNNKEGSNE